MKSECFLRVTGVRCRGTPGEVIHIPLEEFPHRGFLYHEAYHTAIRTGAYPARFYEKLKVAYFCGFFRANLHNILRMRLRFDVHGTFYATSGHAEILEQGVSLEESGYPGVGGTTIPGIFPLFLHGGLIVSYSR
jgi:hypothetical protein